MRRDTKAKGATTGAGAGSGGGQPPRDVARRGTGIRAAGAHRHTGDVFASTPPKGSEVGRGRAQAAKYAGPNPDESAGPEQLRGMQAQPVPVAYDTVHGHPLSRADSAGFAADGADRRVGVCAGRVVTSDLGLRAGRAHMTHDTATSTAGVSFAGFTDGKDD